MSGLGFQKHSHRVDSSRPVPLKDDMWWWRLNPVNVIVHTTPCLWFFMIHSHMWIATFCQWHTFNNYVVIVLQLASKSFNINLLFLLITDILWNPHWATFFQLPVISQERQDLFVLKSCIILVSFLHIHQVAALLL